MTLTKILKWFVPYYKTEQSVVFIKEGTKSEIESCLPVEYLVDEDYEDFKENPPTGVANVRYFRWTLYTSFDRVVMSDIIPWEDYSKPLTQEESKRIGDLSVEISNKVIASIDELDLAEDEKIYLTGFEGHYQKGGVVIPLSIVFQMSDGDSE